MLADGAAAKHRSRTAARVACSRLQSCTGEVAPPPAARPALRACVHFSLDGLRPDGALAAPELEAGEDEDEAVARGLGAGSASGMTDVQRQYADRVKAKLAEVRSCAVPAVPSPQRLRR